jgi:hypothetical protein
MILNNIYKLQDENFSKIKNSNNFLFEEVSTDNIVGEVKSQIYYKDGIYKSVTYVKGEIDSIIYLNTNESNGQTEITEDNFINTISLMFNLLNNDFKTSIVHLIKSNDTQYIIPVPKTENSIDYWYVNKNTGMAEKWETNDSTFTFKITENVVTDADVEKP